MTYMSLQNIPYDTLERIVENLNVDDIYHLSLTCNRFYNHFRVYPNVPEKHIPMIKIKGVAEMSAHRYFKTPLFVDNARVNLRNKSVDISGYYVSSVTVEMLRKLYGISVVNWFYEPIFVEISCDDAKFHFDPDKPSEPSVVFRDRSINHNIVLTFSPSPTVCKRMTNGCRCTIFCEEDNKCVLVFGFKRSVTCKQRYIDEVRKGFSRWLENN